MALVKINVLQTDQTNDWTGLIPSEKTPLLFKITTKQDTFEWTAVNQCSVQIQSTIINVSSVDKDCYDWMGLTSEQLVKFKDDPYWKSMRRLIMLSFWLTLIVMLTSSCIISVLAYDNNKNIERICRINKPYNGLNANNTNINRSLNLSTFEIQTKIKDKSKIDYKYNDESLIVPLNFGTVNIKPNN